MDPWITRLLARLPRRSLLAIDRREGGHSLGTPRPLVQSCRAHLLEASRWELGAEEESKVTAMATRGAAAG